MLNIAMAKIGLERAGVVALVGESVAAGVPQHVGVHLEAQLDLGPYSLDHASEPGRAEGRSPL